MFCVPALKGRAVLLTAASQLSVDLLDLIQIYFQMFSSWSVISLLRIVRMGKLDIFSFHISHKYISCYAATERVMWWWISFLTQSTSMERCAEGNEYCITQWSWLPPPPYTEMHWIKNMWAYSNQHCPLKMEKGWQYFMHGLAVCASKVCMFISQLLSNELHWMQFQF